MKLLSITRFLMVFCDRESDYGVVTRDFEGYVDDTMVSVVAATTMDSSNASAGASSAKPPKAAGASATNQSNN